MSPHICVLCKDKLSYISSQVIDKGYWKPLRAGRNGPNVFHLMFADDLLLFGQATENQMHCVNFVLEKFCSMAEQQVSIEKTNIFFSKNVDVNTRRRLVSMSGFRETISLGKYLGVPLVGRRLDTPTLTIW